MAFGKEKGAYIFMEEQKNLQEEQPRGETSSSKLGTQPVGKLLLKLSIPTITAQLVNALYNIVDRIYIGHMPIRVLMP